jgi:hypothetical protein
MQVETELHNKGADDGDAARCQDRGPLPAHPWQLGGVHKAKGDAAAVRQARVLHTDTSDVNKNTRARLVMSAHISGGDPARFPALNKATISTRYTSSEI